MRAAPVTHTSMHLARMRTLNLSSCSACTLRFLTYGDVEAVNAEGGTPPLPKPMLLGVSFHRFGNLRPPLAAFNLF